MAGLDQQKLEPHLSMNEHSPEHTQHTPPLTAFNLSCGSQEAPGAVPKEGTHPSPESRNHVCQALCLQVVLLRGHIRTCRVPAPLLQGHVGGTVQPSLACGPECTEGIQRSHSVPARGTLCLKVMLAEGPGHSLWSLLVIHHP